MLSANWDCFIISSICMTSFSCLIALTRTSIKMLNLSKWRRHPWSQRKSIQFSPLRIMVAIGGFFLYMIFSKLRKALSNPNFLRVFIVNGWWFVGYAFSASIDMILWFSSVCLYSELHWFLNVGLVLHSRDWLWYMNFLKYC